MKPLFIILIFSLLFLFPVDTYPTHLMGGNLTYEYRGETFPGSNVYRYRITFYTYINCNSQFWGSGFPEPDIDIGIYEGPANPTGNLPRTAILNMLLTDSNYIESNISDTCSVGTDVCIYEIVYIDSVDLPLSYQGYYLYYNRCCRNAGIINLANPGAEGMVFLAYIPPSPLINSSPVFADVPVPFLCEDDTNSLINTAFDPDGDQLIFSFVHPYNGDATGGNPLPPLPNPLNWPVSLVTYAGGYNKNQPFGPNGYAYINAATGYSEYMSPDTGKFVVAVEIKEYRNSNLIGITRRDMQLQILQCPFNPPPNLSPVGGSGQTVYAFEEGDSLCFPITYTDSLGDSLFMVITGPLFDSALTNPPATITSPVAGDSIVTTQFCWNTVCGQGQALPYLFTVQVSDNGCPTKTANEVYQITVSPFAGPAAIIGATSVCPFDSGVSYIVPNISGASYTWAVTNGILISGQGTNSIIVNWGIAGAGNVAVTTTSYLGCTAGPVNLAVNINSYPNADAGPDVLFCSDDTVQLGTGPVANYTYLWSPVTGLSDSSVANPLITLINPTGTPDTSEYIVTTTNVLTTCMMRDTVTVIVYSRPVSDAGPDVSFCSGNSATLGTLPTPNYTYSWSPSAGLNDSAIANPTITLTNFGSAPDTFEYIVITTDTITTCLLNDTVQVIVRPYPTSEAGPGINFCSGDTGSIGTTNTPGYIYLWLPTTGLSDTAISNPLITLVNSDTITDTLLYYVTTTVYNCSTIDSVQVIVYALPIVDAGADKYFCSGDTVQLGSLPIGSYTYLWSPTTGLSDSTIANPQISLTNPFIPNDTINYVVTVTTVFGCVDADTVQVIVNHLPVSEAGAGINFCSGDTGSIGTVTTPGYIYLWFPTTGLSDTAISNPSITLVNSDTITDTLLYYVTTTVGNCSTVDSVQIMVYSLPIVDAGADKYFCSGDTVQLGSPPIGSYTYLWSPATGLFDSTIANPQISLTNPFIPNDTINYVVTVTTVFGCVDADTVQVIVNHLPVSEAGAGINFCSGDTGSIGTTNTPGYTYLWTPTTGLSDTAISNPSITLVNSDTITDTLLYYVTTTVGNCSTVDSVQIMVYSLPIVDAGADKYFCSGDTVQLGSPPIGSYTYLWSPTTGLSDSAIANPQISLTNPFIPNDTIYYVVTVTTVFGCVDADTVQVIVNHLPVSEAGAGINFCSGDTGSIGTVTTPGYIYLWFPTTGLSDTAISNPAITLVNSDTITDTLLYYVTTTVGNCSTVDSVQVLIYPTPIVDAGADVSFCTGDSVQLGALPAVNYTYLWAPDTGLSDPAISNPSVTLTNSGTAPDTIEYVLTAVDTTTYCSSGDTVLVIINPIPTTPIIFGSISVCPGVDSVSYSVNGTGGSTYQWMLSGDGSIITGQGSDSILVNWGASGTGVISVIETDSNSCISDTSFLDVIANVILEPPAPNGPDTVCENDIAGVNYQVVYTNGSVYTWFISGGTITSGNGTNSITVDWDSIGTGMLWYLEDNMTITDTCAGISDTLFVNIYQSPEAVSINGINTVCEDTSAVSYFIFGLPGSSFSWFVNGDTIASGVGLDTIFLVWDSAGTFELSVIETTINGCTEVLTDTITVYPAPQTSSIIGDTAICFEPADTFLYYVTGFLGSVYQWSVAGGTIISLPLTNDSIMVLWDSVVVGLITVVETSQYSCVGDTLNLTVFVNEVPGATAINGDFILCEDTASVSYSISGLPGSYFTWLLNGDTVASGTDIDSVYLVWDSAGVFELSVIETTINSCAGSLADTITVYPKPQTSSIFGDTALCFEAADTFLYYVTGFSGSVYQWSVAGGTIISLPLTNDSIIVRWDSVVVGLITVVETSQDSCVGDTISLTVFVNEVPGADTLNGEFILCQDSIGVSYSIDSLPESVYLWTVSGGSNIIDDSTNTITVDWDSAGVFSISVIEISQYGCIGDTVDSTVVVNPSPQTSSITGDTVVCPPFNLNHIYAVQGFDSSVFEWTVVGGVIDSGQGTDSIFVTWDSSGTASISVVERTQDSCAGDTVWLLNILLDYPSILLKVVSDGEIYDTLVEVEWQVVNNTDYPDSVDIYRRIHFSSYNWDWLAKVPYNQNIYINYAVATHYNSYEYKISGGNACSDIIETSVHNTILLNGNNDESEKSINLGWNRYYGWAQGVDRYEVFRRLDDASQYIFYAGAGTDTIIVFNSGKDGFVHCYRVSGYESGGGEVSWSNEFCVEFEHLIKIPTVITPDGNGWNDTWKIENIELYPECLVEIYNRWGMMVFSSRGYPKDWDGTYKGKELPAGAYFYVINLFAEDGSASLTINRKPYTGAVSVLYVEE